MTFEEAVQKAKEGHRIRHYHFADDEWFEWKNGALRCELGYDMTRWYKGEEWQKNDWSICQ
jgi:methyl coenzyme M reductase gamma subunit